MQVTAPADGATVTTATVDVTGTSTPGATVDVASTATDTGGATTVVTVHADAGGAFSATVPAPFGTSVITVAVTTSSGATGYARRTVVSDFITGTTVLDVTDPSGDDTGPGTYAYPLSDNFQPGAFDIERFQVIVSGDNAVLRLRTRDLSPTFGSPLGAQLVDVFVHTPGAATTSTAPPFASRNYAIADGSAWSRRIEVQGFASPVFVDAAGAVAGHRVGAGQPGLAVHHDVRAARRARHARTGVEVRRRAARAGRLQPRPGPRVPARRRRSSSACAPPTSSARSAGSTPAPRRRRWT